MECTLILPPYGIRRQSKATTALWLFVPVWLPLKRCPSKAFGVATVLHIFHAQRFG